MRTGPQDTWERVLPYAVRAPSSHNTQPWRFLVAADGRLHLYADRSRALPVVDPDGRELVMSCGAALTHLLVALRHLGHAGQVETLPDPRDPDLLAVVGLGEERPPSEEDQRLFGVIEVRSTHRGAFATERVSSQTLAGLRADAEAYGVTLTVLDGDDDAAVAALVGEGDRTQFADAGFRRELAAWIRSNHTRRLDGIRGDALGLGDLASLLAATVVARVDTGAGQARKDEELVLTAPALLLLSTPGDTTADWLSAGQAVAQVLLRAAVHGMAASFLNQPVEVPDLRDRLRDLSGSGTCPQLLLRVGYADPPARPSYRRPVDDVLG